jgi:hypothetical protein
MSIKRDRSSVQPGSVSFHMANEAISQTHDLIIVALASPGRAALPRRQGTGRREQDQASRRGL